MGEVIPMQILFLDTLQTILLDIIVWLIIHLNLGYFSSRIPLEWLNPNQLLFHSFSWEKGGTLYQRIFHVRSWKHLIPDGSRLHPGAFSIKNLQAYTPAYLERWLKESARAEVCHWLMILPGFLFFLWNGVIFGWIMVAYAFLNNLVPIILQRYNRPRIRELLAHLERKTPQQGSILVSYAPQKEISHSY